MAEPKKKRWEGAKKIVSCAAAAALALSLTPAAAFASAGSTTAGGYYDLPTQRIDSFKHSAKDAKGNEYTYSYLSSGIWRVVGGFSQSMYYLMGVNGINMDRGLRNNTPWKSVSNGRLDTNHVTAVDGIMGTSVNTNPDEYLWNSCYNLTQSNFQAAADFNAYRALANADYNGVWSNANTQASAWDTYSVSIGGKEYDMPIVIYREANFISSADKLGDASAWTDSGAGSIAYWVELEQQREGGSGKAYDPYIGSWETNSGGINKGCELMYDLASAVDTATEKSRDANGNATVMSRYVDANGSGTDTSAYASAKALAQRYEDFAKATQYYMVRKTNTGTEKKVAAVICGYNPASNGNEAAYAVRLFNTGTDEHDQSRYAGRLANSIMNFTTDVNEVLAANNVKVAFEPMSEAVGWTSNTDQTEVTKEVQDSTYVRWYYASDIVKYADAVFVTDCPYGNTINTYLASNASKRQSSIYSVDNNSYPQENENVEPLLAAADKAGAKASVYYKFPRHLFGVWYAQGFENCWMGPLAASYLYPDVFTTPENVMAYAARNFWHINTADLNGVLAATCSDISMPKGTTFGTPSANYQTVIDTIMNAGNQYYLCDTAAVEALNGGDLKTYDATALASRTTGSVQNLRGASIDPIANVTYAGKAAEPAVTVRVNNTVVNPGNYKVTYKNNNAAGTATVVVTGDDVNYVGTTTATFQIVAPQSTATTITKKANTITVKAKSPTVKYNKLKKAKQTIKASKAFTVKKAQGKVTYTKASGNSKITVAKNGAITLKKGMKKNTYKIKVNVKAAGNSAYKPKTVKNVAVKIKVS